MKDAILSYIRKRPTATFANLDAAIPGFSGDIAMAHSEFTNVILWPAMSEEAIASLEALLKEEEIVMSGASQLSYFIDGKSPTLPVATGLKAYRTPRWLPVCFSTKADSEVRKARKKARNRRK